MTDDTPASEPNSAPSLRSGTTPSEDTIAAMRHLLGDVGDSIEETILTLSHEMERMRDDTMREAWDEGVRNWAWWKDGVQYVGSCGMTLADALAKNPYRATKGEG